MKRSKRRDLNRRQPCLIWEAHVREAIIDHLCAALETHSRKLATISLVEALNLLERVAVPGEVAEVIGA